MLPQNKTVKQFMLGKSILLIKSTLILYFKPIENEHNQDSKAVWRPQRASNSNESLELFFRKMYNPKTGQFKPEVLPLCDMMNIDTEYLKPRTLDDFKKQVDSQMVGMDYLDKL